MRKSYAHIRPRKHSSTEFIFVQYSKYDLTAKALEFLHRTQNTWAFVDFTVDTVKIYGQEDNVFIYIDEIREHLGGTRPYKMLFGEEATKEVF